MSSTLIFTSLIVTLLVTCYLYVKYALSYWKRRNVPYVDSSFPFGILTGPFLKNVSLYKTFKNVYQNSNAPLLGIYAFLRPGLLVRDPKIVREVLIKEFSSFYHRGAHGNEDVDPMAVNVFVQSGDKWRDARTKLSPGFTSGKLKGMLHTITKSTNPLKEYIGRYADQNDTIEMREVFARYAINVITSVSFGIDVDTVIEDRDSDFRKYGTRVFEPRLINTIRFIFMLFAPLLCRVFRVRFTDKDVGDFMIDVVKNNLEYREKNNISRKDFFQLLMQLRNTGKIDEKDDWSTKPSNSEKSLSVNEMASQAYFFFVAGYESSSTTMSFCMYELAKDQEIQQKVYEDIILALKKHDGQLTYESINDMKYTEQCIDETLRMHTPFGVISRKCVKDFKVPDSDVTIEKGTRLYISIDGLHYDPKYYDDPETFKPERFDEKLHGKKSFIEMPYLPFGDGPRICLGLRLAKLTVKVAIITLLQKYRFELAEEHRNKELEFIALSTAKCSVSGINLKVFLR